jgi:uncharacterized protein (TIGR03118 family)
MRFRLCTLVVPALISTAASAQSTKNAFVQHNLVSDVAGKADVTDLNLVNPWGIAITATSPFWISDHDTGLATVYNGSGTITNLVVKIPPGAATKSGTGTPTGQVPGNGANFILPAPNNKTASFIFSTEDGTISAWNSSVANSAAVIVADNSAAGAVYKGLAIASIPAKSGGAAAPMLYAPNFNTGKVDVFDGSFNPATVSGGFIDPNLPSGFAPFNIQFIGGSLYVAYAKQDVLHKNDIAGPGNGYVDVFDVNGNFLQRLISNGQLNSPWGVAMAPAGWGAFGGDLLVGNFGDGTINAFDPKTGAFVGALQDANGNPIVNPGLWALQFGNGKSGGDPQTLYITSSLNNNDNKTHGLLAAIAPPMQVTGIMNAAGFTSGTIAPGEIVLLQGFSIGPSPLALAAIPATGTLGTTAGNTTVSFNGVNAPILYASASATSVIVPYDVFGSQTANVVVTYKGNTSATFTAQVAQTAPGLFTVGESGTGAVVAVNYDGSLNTANNPSPRGFPVLVYATGEGQTDPGGINGLIASGLFVKTPYATVSATIAGQNAPLIYAGSAVGSVAGVMEVELSVPVLPATTAGGALPITLTVGGVNSQPGTTIFVK